MTLEGTGEDICHTYQLPIEGKECFILTKTVDEATCNPLKLWHAMGEPSSLSEEQKKLLKEAAKPFEMCIRDRPGGVPIEKTLSNQFL